jgi:kinesin family protein 6/9
MSSKDGGAGNIQTFLRIKPSKKPSGYFNQEELDPDALSFALPANFKSEYINNSKLHHNFRFNGIIDDKANQDDVFKKVGMGAVQNALDGFNSTIFAYGQTGSGKTFTLTGGPEKYADRGLIPRSISTLFNEFRSRTDAQFKAYVSYLEIYNDKGYDLLDPSHETKSLEDLPKISLLEDEHGNFHLKNLSLHTAENEEDALNLLFMGDTNRAIAETPMNMASSRSHCIFTFAIEARMTGGDKVRRSKLHLVDLAGSERVGKTNSSGSVLVEAKYINGSLFFLEMVIVALYEKATKGRQHIPYRNSIDRKNSNSNDYYRCITRRFSIWCIILRKIIQTKSKDSVL